MQMRMSRHRSFLSVVMLTCTLVGGCKSSSPTTPATVPPVTTTFGPLSGTSTWVGTWTDTRYMVSGPLSATFTVNGSTVTASGTIGLASLGLGNETGTGTGTVSGNVLAFSFQSATVGTGTGTVNTTGSGSGTGTVTGTLNFGAFTYTGTVSASTISGTFTFTSPTGGFGVASLTRQ